MSYGSSGYGISASGSKAHGNANSDSTAQTNTHIGGKDSVSIVSGGDTNIKGATVDGGQVSALIGGNLNIASIQDTSRSAAHQDSSSAGFSISQGGGSASYSTQHGDAHGDYAGVEEQSGIHAGAGGFDINVKGNTDLHGAYISSDADASKNTLTTGTLSFSDITNTSNYNASSSGFSAGGSMGSQSSAKANGVTSLSNGGGVSPMISQHDSGNETATTKSAIGSGTITITDKDRQTQDVASLNRDTTDLNGQVSKLPDLSNLLNQQASTQQAAAIVAQTVATQIGNYADRQKAAAEKAGDQETADKWKEGGEYRIAMHIAGGAAVAGLGGGNIAVGAAGAGISAAAAGKLNELSHDIAALSPTGNADADKALGQIIANVIVTGAGAAVGGATGAMTASNADMYNRQLHQDSAAKEKTLAKELADKSGGKYTQEQIEDRMRIMGGTIGGDRESGAPATLIGQMPTDSGAKWQYAGTTDDGKPILTQIMPQANAELQNYILANAGSMPAGDVPNIVYDQTGKMGFSIDVTGPFTKFDQSDAGYMRNTVADVSSAASTNAGRFSAATAALAQLPSPYSPALSSASFAGTVAGIVADGIGQLAKPNGAQYVFNGFTAINSGYASSKWPLWTPAINEVTNKVNDSSAATSLQNRVKDAMKK